jgi:hypothetical protein
MLVDVFFFVLFQDYKVVVAQGVDGVAAARSQAVSHAMKKAIFVICCPHKMEVIKLKENFPGSHECVRVVPQEALLAATLITEDIANGYNEYLQQKKAAEVRWCPCAIFLFQ